MSDSTARGCTLFDTPVGRCGLAWRDQAIIGLKLPEADDARTLSRLGRRLACGDIASAVEGAANLPPVAAQAIEQILRLLSAQPNDLRMVPLDMRDVPIFARQVYEISRDIAPGRTMTYGEIAQRLGDPTAARSVGQALGHNPFAIIVPCHRVMAANGKPGGFSANGGIRTKLRLLALESTSDDDLFGWRT